MNAKSLLLIPAAIALGAPSHAYAYIGFGLNLSLPLYFPLAGRPATVVYQAPPQPVAEQVTPAPGPGYVWMSGHWSFYGQKWVWVAGHWELPPSPSAIWVGGHWVQGNSGWVWVDGAWTVGAPPSAPQGPPAPPGAPQAAPNDLRTYSASVVAAVLATAGRVRVRILGVLALQRLAELALQVVEIGLGVRSGSLGSRRRVIGVCSLGSGFLDSHADLPGRDTYLPPY